MLLCAKRWNPFATYLPLTLVWIACLAARADGKTTAPVQTASLDLLSVPAATTSDATSSTIAAGWDPFAYHAGAQGNEFVPFTQGSIPPGIEVLGIVETKARPSVAVLSAPEHTTPFYVREGDIIGVQNPDAARQRARIAQTGTGRAKQEDEVVFIKIGKITDQQVELHPMTNPENVRILR